MQLEIFAGIQQFDASIDAIDTVMRNLTDKKTRAGLVGTIFETEQKLTGMISDLMSVNDRNAIVEFVTKDLGVASLSDSLKQQILDSNSEFSTDGFFDDIGSVEGITDFAEGFDPAFAENRVLVNAIAYSVARARKRQVD